MSRAYILVGSNRGDRLYNINKAKAHIEKKIGQITESSGMYETVPWGFVHEDNFFNQVIVVETCLLPQELLVSIINIEEILGRIRKEEQYSERIIDIDILFYNNTVVNEPDLTIPHNKLHLRKFTLIPLAEIAGEFIHPVFNKTVEQLLEECEDDLSVEKM